ncbi:MAG: hypothetical protein LCH69_02225 [Proteobacteria bacterium]|nr:hypothetical protein [Pseudomonadota bacterium]
MKPNRHFTTRRGFIATLGFGGVSLYGLWAAYGAAPNPFAFFRSAEPSAADADPMAAMAMEGHGRMDSASNVEAFRTELADFVARFSEPDGSVYPRPVANPEAMSDMDMDGMETASIGQATPAAPDDAGMATAVEVLILAERFYFDPPAIRLDLNRPYRFRMLAADVTHGASIQFGDGARMIRLGPGVETELQVTFTRPGSFLVYCTSYCGPGHDGMQARITVV